jgi:hypothetical protein
MTKISIEIFLVLVFINEERAWVRGWVFIGAIICPRQTRIKITKIEKTETLISLNVV